MRNLTKGPEPPILKKNGSIWLDAYLKDPTNPAKKFRYRDPEIKDALKAETGFKCIYCESKIGHNTPGDVEHKIPSSKVPQEHFKWDNLTVACTECNRRKNDYYEKSAEFLDPYREDVEAVLQHFGPLVLWRAGERRAEITVRILELFGRTRKELIFYKIEKLEDVNDRIERFLGNSGILQSLLEISLRQMASLKSEYSAMVLTVLTQRLPGYQWE